MPPILDMLAFYSLAQQGPYSCASQHRHSTSRCIPTLAGNLLPTLRSAQYAFDDSPKTEFLRREDCSGGIMKRGLGDVGVGGKRGQLKNALKCESRMRQRWLRYAHTSRTSRPLTCVLCPTVPATTSDAALPSHPLAPGRQRHEQSKPAQGATLRRPDDLHTAASVGDDPQDLSRRQAKAEMASQVFDRTERKTGRVSIVDDCLRVPDVESRRAESGLGSREVDKKVDTYPGSHDRSEATA